MQRIPHIIAFAFLCLMQCLASLRISYQQLLHSDELDTRVTELHDGVKICRFIKSYLLMTRIFFWPSGYIVYIKLFSGQ